METVGIYTRCNKYKHKRMQLKYYFALKSGITMHVISTAINNCANQGKQGCWDVSFDIVITHTFLCNFPVV